MQPFPQLPISSRARFWGMQPVWVGPNQVGFQPRSLHVNAVPAWLRLINSPSWTVLQSGLLLATISLAAPGALAQGPQLPADVMSRELRGCDMPPPVPF